MSACLPYDEGAAERDRLIIVTRVYHLSKWFPFRDYLRRVASAAFIKSIRRRTGWIHESGMTLVRIIKASQHEDLTDFSLKLNSIATLST